MGTLSLDEIANRIIDAILNQPMINKIELYKVIRPILSIWLKKCNVPKTNEGCDAAIEKLTEQHKLRISRYQKRLTQEHIKQNGYRDKLIEAIGIEEVKILDSILNAK